MPGATAVIALILSGAVSFVAVIGIAGRAAVPLMTAPAPLPWSRPPPPEVHPLDDRVTAPPVPMNEVGAGRLLYLRA